MTNGGSARYRTAQAAVAETLRDRILAGEIEPGTRLLQTDIAEDFETSTTPVREALRQLVAEGLLDGDAYRGVVVHATSLNELEQIYEIRMALEPLIIAATVQNVTASELAQAEELADRMEDETDPTQWTKHNAAFHRILAEAARRPLLSSLVGSLRNISAMYIARSIHTMPERIEMGNAEHRQLLEACRNGDVAKAEAIERLHLEHTLEIGKAGFETPS